MPTDTITIDSAVKARLTEFANQTGQSVDEFVEALLRRIADADIHFDRGVPAFPPRQDAPVLTVEDVDRLANGDEA
jgi:antitoxin component of RelBE/YafQ-DinJ toxin-antitoxin module